MSHFNAAELKRLYDEYRDTPFTSATDFERRRNLANQLMEHFPAILAHISALESRRNGQVFLHCKQCGADTELMAFSDYSEYRYTFEKCTTCLKQEISALEKRVGDWDAICKESQRRLHAIRELQRDNDALRQELTALREFREKAFALEWTQTSTTDLETGRTYLSWFCSRCGGGTETEKKHETGCDFGELFKLLGREEDQ